MYGCMDTHTQSIDHIKYPISSSILLPSCQQTVLTRTTARFQEYVTTNLHSSVVRQKYIRQYIVGKTLVARRRLDTVPPPVVGARKHHNEVLLRVETRQTHSTHHRLRAAHVEGYLIHFRNLLKHVNVLKQDWMHRSQDTSQIGHFLPSFVNKLLITVVPHNIDTVRAWNIKLCVAIHINQIHAIRVRCHSEWIAPVIENFLKRQEHAIPSSKAKIGKRFSQLVPTDEKSIDSLCTTYILQIIRQAKSRNTKQVIRFLHTKNESQYDVSRLFGHFLFQCS